ncbi:MAG TPA: RNA polymerase factor sigma-54 [Polyangiales bacterium]|nr:RNA polymerase factor sigma-54 [Polyangiales bacterium]
MKQVLQLRVSQHLALTPQLQQSIRLLQLSTLELNQEIEMALAENPLLERVDDPMHSAAQLNSDGSLKRQGADEHFDASASNYTGDVGSDAARDHGREDPATDPTTSDFDVPERRVDDLAATDWSASERRGDSEDDERDLMHVNVATVTLREHLLGQLALKKLGERDRGLVSVLIEALEEEGYLGDELEDILGMLPSELDVEEGELQTALTLLQSFDPPGVGARSASECLALQLKRSDVGPAHEAHPAVRELALRLVTENLALLAARDFTRLRRIYSCSDDLLRDSHGLIKRLAPHPGRAFAKHESNYVVPDIIVKKIRNTWQAFLNPEVMPKLSINQAYARVLREQRGTDGAANMSSRLQEARWLIKNVQQRFDTILRVAEAIVERQRSFFTHGEVAMRPLVLREIADTLGLHESTVSRVTTQKFMLTPLGVFELKYFFGSHVATDAGGAASSTAIRALIKQLVGAENAKKPLSDSKIAQMLGEQGIVVARRTIAKYRESLRIPPVSLRKTL